MFRRSATLVVVLVGVVALAGLVLRADQPGDKAPAVTRTVLNQQDLTVPGYAAALVRVQLPVGAREGRHQHPGTLIAVVQEGTMTLEVEGKGTMTYKVGETFSVAPGTVHEGMNKSAAPVTLIASFVFPKDKPMTIPVK